jgi:hypothetical protein
MKCVVRAGSPSVHALGLAATGFSLLVAAAVLPLATSLPCLACGATHAFAAVARLRLTDAFLASPLGALLAVACAVHAAWTALRLCGLRHAPASFAVTARVRFFAIALLAGNWLFLVLHGAP